MDDDLVARADDLNRMFQSVATTVGSSLQAAIINATTALVDFLRLWRDFDQQRSESLQGQLNDTIRERAKLVEEQKALETDAGLTDTAKSLGFGSDGKVTQTRIADLQGKIDALTRQEDQIIGVLQSRNPVKTTPAATTPGAAPALDTEDSRTNRGTTLSYVEQAKRREKAERAATGARSAGGGASAQAANDLEREIEQMIKRTGL